MSLREYVFLVSSNIVFREDMFFFCLSKLELQTILSYSHIELHSAEVNCNFEMTVDPHYPIHQKMTHNMSCTHWVMQTHLYQRMIFLQQHQNAIFCRLVRRLLYLTMMKPDIAYAVKNLSQFVHNPKKSHYEATLRVVRYINGKSRIMTIFYGTK